MTGEDSIDLDLEAERGRMLRQQMREVACIGEELDRCTTEEELDTEQELSERSTYHRQHFEPELEAGLKNLKAMSKQQKGD